MFNFFGSSSSSGKSSETWRERVPTPGQLELAESLKIKVPAGMTQGELSDLITKKKAAQAGQTVHIITELKREVAELQADVQSLKKAAKKTAKKKKK